MIMLWEYLNRFLDYSPHKCQLFQVWTGRISIVKFIENIMVSKYIDKTFR